MRSSIGGDVTPPTPRAQVSPLPGFPEAARAHTRGPGARQPLGCYEQTAAAIAAGDVGEVGADATTVGVTGDS